MSLIAWLVVGILAGWLAERIAVMPHGTGIGIAIRGGNCGHAPRLRRSGH